MFFFALLYWCSLSQRLTVRCPPPATGGVCLATRVRYRQPCALDTWSALLAYLFVSRICVAGLCFCFFALVLIFPLGWGGVCLATRVRYRQPCALDTWSALLAYLFVSRICVAGLCFCFFALVLIFPLPSDQIGGGFLVCYFFLSFSSFVCVFWM